MTSRLLRLTPQPIHQGAVVDPATAGITLRGPAEWSDGTPVKLVYVQLCVIGRFLGHSSGPFEMTERTFEECIANHDKRGLPIPIDYEHAQEADPASGEIPLHGAPSVGWIHSLVSRGADGLWGLVEWLDEAREAIRAGRYAYISPALRLSSTDPKTGKPAGSRLSSAGLVNQPFLSQLPALIAASDKVIAKDGGVERDSVTGLRVALGAHKPCDLRECCDLRDAVVGHLAALDDDDGGAAMKLRDAEGEAARSTLLLREREATITAQTEELRTLRDAKLQRDEADLHQEVDDALETYGFSHKYGPGDRVLLTSWARSDREGFRDRHPLVRKSERHLLANLTGENPRPTGPAPLPSLQAIIVGLQRDKGYTLSEAETEAGTILRTLSRRRAAEAPSE